MTSSPRSDTNVVKLVRPRTVNQVGTRPISLTEEERQLLLEQLAEVTAELHELQHRTVDLAARILGPTYAEQPRSA
ncbi:hypothetical protein GCM10010411_56520 [Actinomadura fulvescens]|uniref:Uncharacterized protein n=1 Tax=Actinomadura fulvescens TaxID=46160 RepID=A0ABP6CFP2_9ACTN